MNWRCPEYITTICQADQLANLSPNFERLQMRFFSVCNFWNSLPKILGHYVSWLATASFRLYACAKTSWRSAFIWCLQLRQSILAIIDSSLFALELEMHVRPTTIRTSSISMFTLVEWQKLQKIRCTCVTSEQIKIFDANTGIFINLILQNNDCFKKI